MKHFISKSDIIGYNISKSDLIRGNEMKYLTKLEETVLVAIWKLSDDAYGVNVRKEVNEISGKKYFYNAIYSTFEQLHRKGFVEKHFGEPTSVRGGKRKIYFSITETGMEAMEAAYERHNRLWKGVTQDAFRKGFVR